MTDAERTQLSPRNLVVAFYHAALTEKDPDKAALYLGDRYVQHNPMIADGPEAFLRFVRDRRDRFPEAHNDVKQVIAEGNLVALHVHSVVKPGTLGRHIVDIFRVQDGKVVEHWDVIQEITEPLYPPIDDNGLF